MEGEAQNTPTATPKPTSIPTIVPTPTPDPLIERMRRDQLAQDLEAEVPSVTGLVAPPNTINAAYLDWLAGHVKLYVPVYMASACLGATEPTVEGFREMVTAGIAINSEGELRWDLPARTNHLIQTINEKAGDGVTGNCLRPYTYPESVADAALAIELCQGVTLMSMPSRFRAGAAGLISMQAADWFNLPEPRQPFLPWLCGQYAK